MTQNWQQRRHEKMKYAAVFQYITDAERVQAARPTHRTYLTELQGRGELFAAGPFPDGSGALIIYEAASSDAAEQLIRADPFHAAGVFVSWTLREWNKVF